jgi:transposase
MSTDLAPIEPAPVLDPTEARRERGRVIALRSPIVYRDGCWHVPSQSENNNFYKVNLNPAGPTAPMCDCPDYEERGLPCKHVFAVQFVVTHQTHADGSVTQTRSVTVTETKTTEPRRPTYKQDWPAYNRAQTTEKARFQVLLHDLCQGIQEPPVDPKRRGRPRNSLRDMLFAVVFKVYSGFSARRFNTDLSEAAEKGYLSKSPHFNAVLDYLDNADMASVLHRLIVESSLPLKEVEVDFAVDSTGFTSCRFDRWYDHKYGKVMRKHSWVKAHFMTGVKTNVVTAVEIRDKDAGDAPMLPGLVKTTREGFEVKEVSADKAYLSQENLNAIVGVGATPYIAVKKSTTGGIGGELEKMFHVYCLNRESFLNHYHKRSNVESTVSMIKAKFDDHVRSKTDVAMKNEVLAKILCHNICCLIQSFYELGIEAEFWREEAVAEETVIPASMGDVAIDAWDWL